MPGTIETGIEVDERDDVDELGHRLKNVVDRAKSLGNGLALGCQHSERDTEQTAIAVATSTWESVSMASAHMPMKPIQTEHRERRQGRVEDH